MNKENYDERWDWYWAWVEEISDKIKARKAKWEESLKQIGPDDFKKFEEWWDRNFSEVGACQVTLSSWWKNPTIEIMTEEEFLKSV